MSRDYLGEFFQSLLLRGEIQIEHRSFISLRLKPGLNLPKADWIFFLSPSGVQLFAERFNATNFKIGVIGPGTAREVEARGWEVSFLPQSTDPEEGVLEFSRFLPSHETVIMACSNKSLKRMHGKIPENKLIEWEFYENIPVDRILKTSATYIVFTSPSNADAYLDIHDPESYQIIVAIGKTTFAALKKRGISSEILRAQHPTEESIWEAIYKHTSR